jgi:hypothetical protein
MKLYQVREIAPQAFGGRNLTFSYRAKGPRHAIKMVANRHGNPHYSTDDLSFNRYGDEALLRGYVYTAEEIAAA